MKLLIVEPHPNELIGLAGAKAESDKVAEADYVITEDGRILKDRHGDLEVEKV
jgi:hypothetical protein